MEMKDAPMSAADRASIDRQPKTSDPQEKRIVDLLERELLSTQWARNLFKHELRNSLINYFKDSLEHLDDINYIHNRTQDELKRFADLTNARIIEGSENLEPVKKKNVFLLTNHLGTYKLLGLSPEGDLGLRDIGLDVLHPFPAFYGSLYPVSNELDDSLYESAHDYPSEIRQIQRSAGSLILPPGKTNTLQEIENQTKEMFDGRTGIALTIFPEGGTSGKRNLGGPYTLDRFRTGSLVIAGNLGIPILPVAQYFNPEKGFELKVFPSIMLNSSNGEEESRDYFAEHSTRVQSSMQDWLDSKTSE